MPMGIFFVIAFGVAALVFAGIIVVRVLKKEKNHRIADSEANGSSTPLPGNRPKEEYTVAILISILSGLLVAAIVYFVGKT